LFWPDLAYGKDVLVRLEELKIEYVPKEENPPNVPQKRPIENFWVILKRKVYINNYPPKDVKCLMAKISKELKSIETTGLCRAMNEVPAKAHKMGVTFICN
jgi:transposase